MTHLINSLREVAPIKAWTVWPHSQATGEDLAAPPIVWWTYQQPSKDIEEFLQNALDTFQGTLPWQMFTTGARWILMPARIREYDELHGCHGDLIAAAKLRATDPDFGKRANAESHLLAEHIHHCLQHASENVEIWR